MKTKAVGGIEQKDYTLKTSSTSITENNGINEPQVQAAYGASDTNEYIAFFVNDTAGHLVDFMILKDFSSNYAYASATRADGSYPYQRSCQVVK